jgi:hypothetical protein
MTLSVTGAAAALGDGLTAFGDAAGLAACDAAGSPDVDAAGAAWPHAAKTSETPDTKANRRSGDE